MSEITRAVIGMPFDMAMESELSRRQFHSRAQALLSENEALRGLYQMHKQTETREMRDLKAEVAGLKTGYEAYERVNAELRAECEELRKDCERLNFIESQNHKTLRFNKAKWSFEGFTSYEYSLFSSPREAIDAAMNKENPS